MTDIREKDKQMVQQIGAMLETSVRHLDASHLESLRLARQRAVEEAAISRWRRSSTLLLAAAASVATIAASAVLFFAGQPGPADDLVASVEETDFELLLGEESLDMLADYDFYDWLSAEADAG